MARDEPQVNLRIPVDLKERLDRASTKNKRSLTAEMVARLSDSFELADEAVTVDTKTMDLFAESVAGRVVQALDERDKKKKR